MSKKVLTTTERFLQSLTPKERKQFDKEHKEFLISEMILAAMAEDNVSVRQLAKLAGVSPTLVQDLRSGVKQNATIKTFLKIVSALGYNILLEKNGEFLHIDGAKFETPKKKELEYEVTSGNIFADLGLSNPEELHAKVELCRQICNLIKEKKLTDVQTAKFLGVEKSAITSLHSGEFDNFSIETLSKFLGLLAKPTSKKPRKPSINVAGASKQKQKKILPIVDRNKSSEVGKTIYAQKKK